MSTNIVVRSDEEILEIGNALYAAMDDGVPGASKAIELLEWLIDKDSPKPQFD